MDQSLPFMSRKVVRFAEYEQVYVQEGGEIEGSKITSCLNEDSGLDEKTGVLEMGRRVAVSGSYAESDLEASADVSVENAIMDKLFQACDPAGKGKVRVSDLVEYLTTILDMQLHRSSAVSSLISVMDPNHINSEIDAETFHRGFHKWIEQMKSGSLMDMSLQPLGEESLAFDNSHSIENTEYSESWGEDSSLEDRLSISQLSSSLTDLQHINRKLSEEIKESRTVIDVKEEELSKLSKDLQMSQSQVKRLQELADLRHEAEIENEELQEEVATLSKQLETEKLKKHQTEQEKELLKAQLQRYKAQVSKLTAELDVSQQGQEDLKAQLAMNKEKISQLKVAFCGLDSQLAEANEHIEELQRCVQEVSKVSEDLKKQNREIQEQLSEAQQNLHSFKSVVTNTSTHEQLSTLREMASEIEDDMEQLKIMNANVCTSSIHNELQFLLNDSPNLPWPLSEKELKESVVATPDLVSQVGNAVMMSRQSTTEKGKSYKDSDCDTRESEKPRDIAPGTCHCSCDCHYDVSHEKLRRFVSVMKYFRDENKKLRRIVTKCCLTRRIVTELDGQGNKATPVGRAEQSNKPVVIEGIHQTEIGESVIKLQTCSNENLLLDIAELRRSHLKLAEDLHNSEIHICELDEELHNTQLTLNIEKQRCAELEESLCSSTLARQLDLKDIWRLVQKDVETECEEFQDDSINTNATDQLKEKITKEIEALRNNCEKKQSFLGSLKNNNLDLHFTRNNDFYRTSCWNYGRKLSPSSPLVDALTIDAFNGNFPMHHINYPYQSAFVSCEDVDCYECRAARLFLQSRFAASCPSMVPSAVTQGLELNSNDARQSIEVQEASSEVCHNSAEVATDINIQVTNTPKRKRSLYGSFRRQDFIKSSGRCAASRTSEACSSGPQLGFGACVHTDNCSTLYNNNKTSFPSFTCNNFLPSNCNLNDTHDEPSQGIRRPSFTLAVECNHHLSLDDSQQPQSKEDNFSFTEELRRPSFKAAIERGKDNYSAPNPTAKRKFVQIASPEISESRKITALSSPESLHKDEGNLSSLELPKSVKFYLDETDKDPCVQAGSMKLSSSSQQNNCDALSSLITPSSSLSSSQSSALMSASWFSSMSSSSGFDDLGHSFILGSRYSQEKEDISGCAFTEKEHGHHLTDMNDVPTADGSQHSRHMEEVIRGPYTRNVVPYGSPQSHHIKVRTCKPAVSARPSNSFQCSAHNAAATPTTASLHSHPLRTSSLAPSLASSAVPMKSLTESHNHETPRDGRHVAVNINPGIADISPDFSGCGLHKPRRRVVVVDSPSDTRCFLSAENTKLTAVPSTTVSEIRQGHLASKKREQMKAQSMKLPEMIKTTCLDARNQLLVSPGPDMRTAMVTPQISVTDEDAEPPPGPSGDIVTPSLPDSFLGKLGLSVTNSGAGTQISIDELSEKEVESKFVTLSLAYKTDKHTLDKRVSAQERARDLAEQNVDIELKDLKHAVEALSEMVSDAAVRNLLQKIKLHIDVLQQATARVSSQAEVYGAVQQERRLCKAMEVMVQYTENLRRVREKEELELNEARKLLSERSGNSLSVDSDPGLNKRSLSVSGYSAAGRMSSAMSPTTNVITNAVNAAGDFTQCASMRRRSEVALPKIIGGAGSPSLTPNTSQDPKSRFQSAIASTSMQNIVATTMKHCSLEKQLSAPSSASVSSSAYHGNASSASWSTHKEPHTFSGDKLDSRMSKDEEAFRKGFEEGLKTRLSHELTDLRDQQNSISNSLEHMIDRVEQSQIEDEEYFKRPSRLISALSLASTVGGHVLRYDWRSNKNIVRNLAGVLFLLLACLVVYLSPPLSTIDVKHFTKPPQ
ncbi:hypothetical protein BsWGS_27692 [Bradybaena similaris]